MDFAFTGFDADKFILDFAFAGFNAIAGEFKLVFAFIKFKLDFAFTGFDAVKFV